MIQFTQSFEKYDKHNSVDVTQSAAAIISTCSDSLALTVTC